MLVIVILNRFFRLVVRSVFGFNKRSLIFRIYYVY